MTPKQSYLSNTGKVKRTSMKMLTFQSYRDQILHDTDLKDIADTAVTLMGGIALLLGTPLAAGAVSVTGTVTDVVAGARNTFTHVLSPAAALLALGEKEKVVKSGAILLDAILKKKPRDYSGRIQTMEQAYCTICYTAFFDELDTILPNDIRRKIPLEVDEWAKLRKREQTRIFSCLNCTADDMEATFVDGNHGGNSDAVIWFPDALIGTEETEKRLAKMYRVMADRLWTLIMDTAFVDVEQTENGEYNLRRFNEICKQLPLNAIHRFSSYYLTLCKDFNEFYIYTRLGQERRAEIQAKENYQTIISAALQEREAVNAGFSELSRLIVNYPTKIKKQRVQAITDTLIYTYQQEISKTLRDDWGRLRGRDSNYRERVDPLCYPPVSESFVPQSFKLFSYTQAGQLEMPEAWKAIPPRNDMLSFIARYLLDLGSTENLLLILGEPGSGKSMLAKTLCARLIDTSHIILNIPLRDYSLRNHGLGIQQVNSWIENMILKQIERDGDSSERIPSLKWFQEEFPLTPMTIIFDGYDEILQATGLVYQNLLDQLHRFQIDCLHKRRPLRIIVTSRDTLINKAEIPFGTTIMKLLEFDKVRKSQWSEIWNRYNRDVLAGYGLDPFAIDESNVSVAKLSGQPLLLLMLAIYDADFDNGFNALKTTCEDGLNRANLYNELLRRFIRREKLKGSRGMETYSFEDAGCPEDWVDDDMRRLGVVAAGMFMRGKLSISAEELHDDLNCLNISPVYRGSANQALHSAELDEAEALFGSFFFIHASNASKEERERQEIAYEFLHKTFYEFLLADIILSAILAAVNSMDKKRGNRENDSEYQKILEDPSSPPFDSFYYSILSVGYLCRDPEVVRMIREWRNGKLQNYFFKYPREASAFGKRMINILDDILRTHLSFVQQGKWNSIPRMFRGLNEDRYSPQVAAIYLLNLVSLQIITSGQCKMDIASWTWLAQYVNLFAHQPIQEELKGPPGNQFEHYWKRNKEFSWEQNSYELIVLQFMSLFKIRREKGIVYLTKRKVFINPEKKNLVQAKEDLFDFLGDEFTLHLYALHDETHTLSARLADRAWLVENGLKDTLEYDIVALYTILLNPMHGSIEEQLDSLLADSLTKVWESVKIHRSNQSLIIEWMTIVTRIIEIQLTNIAPICISDYTLQYMQLSISDILNSSNENSKTAFQARKLLSAVRDLRAKKHSK